jgi:hypothetical protein
VLLSGVGSDLTLKYLTRLEGLKRLNTLAYVNTFVDLVIKGFIIFNPALVKVFYLPWLLGQHHNKQGVFPLIVY